MTNLPASSTVRSVPISAPPPSKEWLAGRVVTFLGHYFHQDTAGRVFEAMVEDWTEVLADLPQRAIELAIWERLRSTDRKRPLPGEIRAAARKFISFPPLRGRGDGPMLELVTPERAAEIAEEVGGICARKWLSPSEETILLIIDTVADVWGVTREGIQARRKGENLDARWELTAPRHAVSYLCRLHTSLSWSQIARVLGATDHSTVIDQSKAALDKIEADPDFAARIEEVNRRLSL